MELKLEEKKENNFKIGDLVYHYRYPFNFDVKKRRKDICLLTKVGRIWCDIFIISINKKIKNVSKASLGEINDYFEGQ